MLRGSCHVVVIGKFSLLVALDDVPAFHRLQGDLPKKHLQPQKLQMDTQQPAMGGWEPGETHTVLKWMVQNSWLN